MRTFLIAMLGTVAIAGGASAQSLPFAPQSRAEAAALASQNAQAATQISRECGVNYAIGDPDPNIRLELRRQCASGLDGGGD